MKAFPPLGIPSDGAVAAGAVAEPAVRAPKKGRKWVWIVAFAALLLAAGAAATVYFLNQAAQREQALAAHTTAVADYEDAWSAFERQNADTRDDQAKLSMTSLDNYKEVSDALDKATAEVDSQALTQLETPALQDGTPIDRIEAETKRVTEATAAVTRATATLSQASEFFVDSHRTSATRALNVQVDHAKQALEAAAGRTDDSTLEKLRSAIAAAEKLTSDDKVHPNDLRRSMEELALVADQVAKSAAPRPEDANGAWVQRGSGPKMFGDSLTIDYPRGSAALYNDAAGGRFDLAVASDGSLTGRYFFEFRALQSGQKEEASTAAVMYPRGVARGAQIAQSCPSETQEVLNDTSIDRLYLTGLMQESCGVWVRK